MAKKGSHNGTPLPEELQPHAVANKVTILQSVEQVATNLLGHYNLPSTELAQLKADYGKLTIAGPDDKETYKTATAALTRVRNLRTGVEATRKVLKQPFWDAGLKIDAEAKRLTAELQPIETHLAAQIKTVDDEAERRRKAEEIRRVNLLTEAGFTLVGQNYVAGKIVLPWDEIVKMEAQMLDDNIAAGKAQLYEAAAERKRQADAQAKIDADRAELEKLRQQLADKEAELNAKLAPASPAEAPVRDWMDSGGDGGFAQAPSNGTPFDEPLPPVVNRPAAPPLQVPPVVTPSQGRTILPSMNTGAARPYTMADARNEGVNEGIEMVITAFTMDNTPRKKTEWVEIFRKLKKSI